MRKFAVALCLFAASVLNAQTLTHYVGTWRVDPDRVLEKTTLVKHPASNSPEIPPPPPPGRKYTLEHIRQAGQILKISGGEAGTTAVYTIDPTGKEVSDAIADAPGNVRIATTHWDKRKLVTDWKMQRNGETFLHGTDVHSLTTNGQLVVSRTIESPRHRAEVRLLLLKVP